MVDVSYFNPSPVPTNATQSLGGSPLPTEPTDRGKELSDRMDKLTAEHEVTVAKERKENEKTESDFFAKNPAPVFKPPAPFKSPQQDSDISMWGALAIGFAALASHFTRTPMTTALNAAGAALKGMKEQNNAATQAAYQQWKDASEQTFKLYEYERDAYKELVTSLKDRLKNNIDLTKEENADYRAKFAALGAAFKDETGAEALRQGGFLAYLKLHDARDEHMARLKQQNDQFEEKIKGEKAEFALKNDPDFKKMVESGDTLGAAQKLAEVNPSEKNVAEVEKIKANQEKEGLAYEKFADSTGHQAAQLMEQWKSQHPDVSVEDTIKAQNEIYSSFRTTGASGARLLPPLTDEQVPFQAKEIGEYKLKAPSQMQMARQPGWDKVLAEAEKQYPGFNPAKYDLVQKARAKLETGKDADAIASYDRLNQHLEFFQGLVDRLGNEDPKALNSFIQAWAKQTGNPNVTSFDTAAELVGDEVVKAVTGTGAAGALGDRDRIKANLDHSLGRDQLMANINAIKALVGGAIVTTRDKYKTILPPEELNAIFPSPEVLEDYHINPATGKIRVEGIYDFGGVKSKIGPNGVEPVGAPAAAAPAATGFKPQWTDKNGRPFGVSNGKYVYEDGSPVQ